MDWKTSPQEQLLTSTLDSSSTGIVFNNNLTTTILLFTHVSLLFDRQRFVNRSG